MFLRHLRASLAGFAAVAAVCAGPAAAKADVQILIEELNGSGTVIASQFSTFANPGTGTVFSPVFTGSYFTGQVNVTSNSNTTSSVASLTPAFSGRLTSAFDVSQDHKLRVTVTDDAFTPLGPTGTLRVQTSGSNGFASGTESVASETRIYNPGAANSSPINPPPAPGQVPASSNTLLADGQTIAGPISLFTPDGTLVTGQSGVTGLSSPFAIQQTILVSFSGTIPQEPTFGATGGASVTSNPAAAVPAPGGLALALAALPLIGLRRTLRRRSAD